MTKISRCKSLVRNMVKINQLIKYLNYLTKEYLFKLSQIIYHIVHIYTTDKKLFFKLFILPLVICFIINNFIFYLFNTNINSSYNWYILTCSVCFPFIYISYSFIIYTLTKKKCKHNKKKYLKCFFLGFFLFLLLSSMKYYVYNALLLNIFAD